MSTAVDGRLAITPQTQPDEAVDLVRAWITANVPLAWREGGPRRSARYPGGAPAR